MPQPFELTIDGENRQTMWPWNTLESMYKIMETSEIKMPKKGSITFEDCIYLAQAHSGTATGQSIAKELKRNERRSSSAIKNGTIKGIKDLFTAGCPMCDRQGIPIPGKEGMGIPFLHCENCKGDFPVKSIHEGKAAFSIGAGPSLTKNGKELQKIQGEYPIFACDAAVKPLLKMGVIPDYVVTLEWDPLSQKFFEDILDETRNMTLLIAVGACPEVRINWKGPVYTFATPVVDARSKKQHLKYYGDIGTAMPGGNVTASILSMFTGIRINPAIFVGHDFSFDHIENYFAEGAHMGCAPLKEQFKTHDIYGKKVFIDQTLYGYKTWHEGVINHFHERGKMLFVNATEGGILGTSYYDPKKFIWLKRVWREFQYSCRIFWAEHRWPSAIEIGENGFRGENLKSLRYMSLGKAIDIYCPKSHNKNESV